MTFEKQRSSWDRAHNFVYVLQGIAHAIAPFSFLATGLLLIKLSQGSVFDNSGQDDLRTIAAGLFGSATSWFLSNRSGRREDVKRD